MPRRDKSNQFNVPSNDDESLHTEKQKVDRQDVEPVSQRGSNPSEFELSESELSKVAQNIDKPWSRRRFLRRTAGSFAALIVAACNRAAPAAPTPTPTKTPYRTPSSTIRSLLARPTNTPIADSKTFLPVITNGTEDDQPIAAAQLATDTPIPPTDLPPTKVPPTATPTPTPPTEGTPFPPGPPSKLGLHVERNSPEIFDLLETGGVATITTLELDANFAAQIKQMSPATKLIGRIVLPQVQLDQVSDPTSAARAFVEELLPYADDARRRDHFDGWISHNEPTVGSENDSGSIERMKRLSEFEAERTRLLGERGIRSVIGNFATGGPDLSLWEHFLPAVQAAQEHNGWLGLHEYSAPTIYYLSTRANQGRYPDVAPQDEGWLTLRYRKVYNQFLLPAGLGIPLVFTECGVDGLVEDRPGPKDARGWQEFQQYWAENGYGLWGPGAYVEQLVWFDKAMSQDWYVLGGCIYALGTSSQWLTYDIAGPVSGVLKQYLSVHAQG